jgi:DNA modification methylase
MTVRLLTGDCRDVLKTLPGESVHCVVTSPPYYGLRDYGVAGQIGLEASPAEYVAALVDVFREVRRVLRSDGTCWIVIGDSYAGSWGNQGRKKERGTQRPINGPMMQQVYDDRYPAGDSCTGSIRSPGVKPKDLIGIPWMVAFALRADGWYLRQDIIWSKPNPMPESVTDRCTKAHEYVFLLSKAARYYYDAEAIAEASVTTDPRRPYTSQGAKELDGRPEWKSGQKRDGDNLSTRNKRSVWTVASEPFSAANLGIKVDHFAVFPPALIEPCILAGTSARGVCAECGAPWVRVVERENNGTRDARNIARAVAMGHDPRGPTAVARAGGSRTSRTVGWQPSCACNAAVVPATVLDPFAGAGTTCLVADRLGRSAIGIELNPEYGSLAHARLIDDAGLFAQVAAE